MSCAFGHIGVSGGRGWGDIPPSKLVALVMHFGKRKHPPLLCKVPIAPPLPRYFSGWNWVVLIGLVHVHHLPCLFFCSLEVADAIYLSVLLVLFRILLCKVGCITRACIATSEY